MKFLRFLFPRLGDELRTLIRKEVRRDVQQNLVTHSAARQSLDLYEMKLETLDTRLAKRMMALEARISELEMREETQPTRRVA